MTSTESSPGSLPSPEVTAVPPLESALRFGAVNTLWERTRDVHKAHRVDNPDTGRWEIDDASRLNEDIEAAIRDYLISHGLDESSSEFMKLSQSLRRLSFDRMSNRRWKYGDWQKNPDGSYVTDSEGKNVLKPGTSGESRVYMLQMAFTGRDLEEEARVAEHDASLEADEEEATPEKLLKDLRTAKYDAFVNRMKGSAFGRKRRENQEKYEQAEQAYMEALAASNEQALAEERDRLIAEGKTDDEIAAGLKDFAKKEAEKINKEDQEAQHTLLIERSGPMGWLLNWYGERSTATKVALGLGLSGVAIASGVGLGLAAGFFGGAVGAGLLSGAGFGMTRAWGAARTYQLRLAELYRNPTHNEQFELADGDSSDDLHLRQRSFLETTSRDQLLRGEKIKRRAVYWALGTTALGGALGVVGHVAADGWSPWHIPGGQAQHWLEEQMQNHPNTGTGSGSTGGILADKPEIEGAHQPGATEAEAVKDYIREHAAARHIDKGEGWYQTFKELGVKQEDWHNLLQEVGPKLHDVEYGGVRASYWDTNAHEWRINMTDNSKMSPDALKIIVQQAEQKGYLKNPLDFTGNHDVVDTVTTTPTHSVKLWHGAATEHVLQKTYPGLSNREAFSSVNDLYDKFGGKGVFEVKGTSGKWVPLELTEHDKNNIWIMQDSGRVRLTDAAHTYLDNAYHPSAGQSGVSDVIAHPNEGTLPSSGGRGDYMVAQGVEAGPNEGVLPNERYINTAIERIINEGDSSPVNVAVEQGKGWGSVFDSLRDGGVIDVPKGQYAPFMRQVWPELKNLTYDDRYNTPVAYLDRFNRVRMNTPPFGIVHPDALRLIAQYAEKNNYDLVA